MPFPPLLVPLLPSSNTHTHAHNPFSCSNWPAFPSPSPFHRPVTHCAGKSDFLFSPGSKLKALPSWRVRSHILGLSADPQEPASPPGSKKNLCCLWEKTSPTLPFFPYSSIPLQVPCKSWVMHTQTHLSGFHWMHNPVCARKSSQGLLPIGSRVGR